MLGRLVVRTKIIKVITLQHYFKTIYFIEGKSPLRTFGRAMRQEFLMNPNYKSLNHGSYGRSYKLFCFIVILEPLIVVIIYLSVHFNMGYQTWLPSAQDWSNNKLGVTKTT